MASEFSASALSDALVILGAAGVVIPAFARFRISPVIGFLLIGLLEGPNGLGQFAGDFPWLRFVSIANEEAIAPFAEFGIILLLFSVGLELSFKRLWGMRRLVFGVGAAQLFISAACIGAGLALLGNSLTAAVALGLALALSSTALVLKLVDTSTPVGRAALAILLFEDLAIVPIIFALGALAPRAQAGSGLEGLFTTLVLGLLVVITMLFIGRLLLPRLFAQAARTKSPELFLAASLLVVIAASLATAAVGLSPIVGAIVAGILIAETDYHDEVEIITAPFQGLALGVFLITVGMSVDLVFIAERWPAILMAVIGVLVVKAVVTGLLMRLYGKRSAVAAEAGVVMASPSETTLIVLATAATAGIISSDAAIFWKIVTAIGLTITPLLAKLGQVAARRVDVRSDEGLPLPAAGQDSPAVVIIGFGRVGRLVARMLTAHEGTYVAVDSGVDAVAAARREGRPIVFGDVSRPELVDRLNLGHAGALVLTMDDPVLTVRLVRRVRGWCPGLPIVARARDTAHAVELYRAGATNAVSETLESSLQLSEALLVDLGIPMGPVIASIHEKRGEMRQRIREMGDLDQEPATLGRRLRDA